MFEAAREFVADDAFMMAGHLTYMSVLSLFPFLIFLVTVAGFFGQTEAGASAVDLLLQSMPPAVAQVFERPIRDVVRGASGGLMTFGIVGALWTAASALEAARAALNRAYDIKTEHPIWRTRLESLGLVLSASVLLIVAMLPLLLGPLVWRELEARFHLPAADAAFWNVLRYVLGASLILATLAGLYRLLPAIRLRWRWVLPGAGLTVGLWLIAATGFSMYLKYAPDYTLTYGSLAGIILALLFFYALAAIFLFGAEWNAAIARREGGLPPRRQAV